MYNPCQLLTVALVQKLMSSGNRYFLQQLYPRGDQPYPEKKGIIVTHYCYHESALHHFDALGENSMRLMYDAFDSEQRSQLMIVAAQPEGFNVYSSLFAFGAWEPPKDLQNKMKRYLTKKTKFRLSADVDVVPYMHLGEMCIRVTKGFETTKIPLAELEKV